MTGEAFAELAARRSSARDYDARPVPRGEIAELLRVATLAPSGQNRQPWTFHVVDSPARIEALARLVESACDRLAPLVHADHAEMFANYRKYFAFFRAAPALVFVAARPYESMRALFRDDADPSLLPEADDTTHVQSASAAVAHLLLAAEARGLSACWNTNVLVARREIEADLAIRDPWRLLAMVSLGYPRAGAPPPAAKRRHPVPRVTAWHG